MILIISQRYEIFFTLNKKTKKKFQKLSDFLRDTSSKALCQNAMAW